MLIHRQVRNVRVQQSTVSEMKPVDVVLFFVMVGFALIAAGLCS